MRKSTCRVILLLLFFLPLVSLAQSNITGQIIGSKDKKPIEGATVKVKGKTIGVKTDSNGNFSIAATKGDVLEISSISYSSENVRIKDATNYIITLQKVDVMMEEVVVTAMDIRKSNKELTYSTGKVSGTTIQESQRENFLNGLDGRVAGLTINSTSGMAGASSSIVLRGFNSMALDNQPLFVVDGVIMDNSTVNETSNTNTGLGLVENSTRNVNQTANRSTDYTNRIADINPNDIENVTVLKGPEATALYGSQASSGAIIITTRKGRTDGKKVLTYDNSFRITELTRFPTISRDWALSGFGTGSFTFFGGPQDPNTPKYDNLRNFFQTGFLQTHNLGFETGNTKYSFRGSTSYLTQSGIVPNNDFKRISFKLNYSTNINKYITFAPSVTFTSSTNDKPKRGAGGYMLNLMAWPNTNDARNFETADGKKITILSSSPNGELDNPFFSVQYNRGYDNTKRIAANAKLTIKPVSWFTVSGIFGIDKYSSEGYSFYHPLSAILTKAQGGSLDNYYINYNGYNHTINATATKKFRKFGARVMVGTMWQDYKKSMYSLYGTNIVDSVNTAGQMVKNGIVVSQQELQSWNGDSSSTRVSSRQRLSRGLKYGEPNYVESRQLAYFGEASINYDEKIFLNYSHRFEHSSIFPKEFRNYDYPSAGLSFIMSDILPFMKKGGAITYWKLRTSLATTARSPLPYSNQSVFTNALSSGTGFYYGFTNNNPLMEPELQNTYEIGTEMRILKDRIGFDVTYYNTLNKKQIAENFRASYATGFVLNTLNVGTTRNQGVEVSLDFTPIKTKNLTWKSQVNFNHMWNKVITLPDNVPEFYISDSWVYANARGGLVKGGPTTSITSFGYERNNNGDILINPANGLPVIDQTFRVRGDRNPDFTLGWSNNIKYKNWTISFLWDAKKGGDIFNANEMYLTQAGLSQRTNDRLTARVIKGVLKDGLQNSATPTQNTIAVIPALSTIAYYTTTMPEEEFIEKDVNWVRLREATIRYNFPASFYKRLRVVNGLSAFVTGNDLLLFTNYTGADPASNANTAGSRGVGAWGFDYGNTATPISVNFGFKVVF